MIAHEYARNYARMLLNRPKGAEFSLPRIPFGLFEHNSQSYPIHSEPNGREAPVREVSSLDNLLLLRADVLDELANKRGRGWS
jgi:hypothetical protein